MLIHSRVEAPQYKLYDGISSCAFASIEDMVRFTQNLLAMVTARLAFDERSI